VTDLVRAVETETQLRTSIYEGRAAIEKMLSCYAAHLRGSLVPLPLFQRTGHPRDIRG
jgi:hypothetical protein